MVVEVGMSGSRTLNQLRHSAYRWLTHHDGKVRIVLLIYINHAQQIIEMEKWQMVPRPHRSGSSMRPGVIQSLRRWLDLNNAMPDVQGAPLSLGLDLLFDTIPPQSPATGIESVSLTTEYFRTAH